MKESLFDLLHVEELDRLALHYRWESDTFSLYAAREWDEDTDFSRYNRSFTALTLRPTTGRYLNHADVLVLAARRGLLGYLEHIKDMMRKGRHILMDFYYHKRKNIRFTANIHCDRPGINNLHSSLFIGGIRRHELDEPEADVVFDGLNLGRGMAFKNAAAGIPMGGCKVTVQMEPINLDDLDAVGFLAYANDRVRNTTGPDMRFPPELTDVMKRHFSPHITGATEGPLGPTGIPAAWGVYAAVKQAARFAFGSEDLAGHRIAVQGLGIVGSRLAEAFLQEGATLFVADTDPEKVRRLVAPSPERITPVEPDHILGVEADILVPAAGGAILDERSIDDLRVKVVLGAANNVLKASGQEEEIDLAKRLARRGILYQVDWYHNVGGVMGAYEEYIYQERADQKRLMKRVWDLIGKNTRKNLDEAAKKGMTPTERAYRIVEDRIYGQVFP